MVPTGFYPPLFIPSIKGVINAAAREDGGEDGGGKGRVRTPSGCKERSDGGKCESQLQQTLSATDGLFIKMRRRFHLEDLYPSCTPLPQREREGGSEYIYPGVCLRSRIRLVLYCFILR